MADDPRRTISFDGRPQWRKVGVGLAAIGVVSLAGCAAPQTRTATLGGSRGFDPKLGVFASPRVVADGDPVPRGGGQYLVGRPYVIGGRSYYPSDRPNGYSVVGTASWYGDAFHGRRTANGEVFDKNSISAAHPTLPLPSYVRVTNMGNGRSMIVRVNDRGPYHGGRVMDVSQRVAEALNFKSAGTARIKVEYVGRAGLRGSDDGALMATLSTDGAPAQWDRGTASQVATNDPPIPEAPASPGPIAQIAREPRLEDDPGAAPFEQRTPMRRRPPPLPLQRPYDVGDSGPPAVPAESRPPIHFAEPLAAPSLVSFAPAGQ